jgi:signal transduction histidine kinase
MKLNQQFCQPHRVPAPRRPVTCARVSGLLILLQLSVFHYSIAQKQGRELTDSLLSVLETDIGDSSRVRILATVSMHFKNFNPNEGIQYGQKALELATTMEWKKGIALSYGSIASNYSSKSDDVKVLEYLFKELKIAEEVHDTREVAGILSNVGIVYQSQENPQKALGYYLKGLKMLEQEGDALSLSILNGNIATVYFTLKDYPRALEYNKKAMTLATETGDRMGVATYLEVMADIYNAEGNYHAAIEYELQALRISEEMGDSANIGTCLGYLGAYYLTMAQDNSVHYRQDSIIPASRAAMLNCAIDYLIRGIDVCKKISYLDGVSDFSRHLSRAYELTGKFKESLAAYRYYTALKDSILSFESKVTITNMETRRELDLKEKQIELDRLAVVKKRNERGFFIAGMALLTIIIANVFRNFKVQKGLNKMLFAEKQKVEEQSETLRATNNELNVTLKDLKETQQQLIVTEKQKENEMIRSRLSQDIHDDVSSELTKISWISALAKAKAKKEDIQEVTALLDKISGYSQGTVAKLGEIIWTVNPNNDTLDSLLAYMRNYISKFLADTPLKYTIDFPDTGTKDAINPELKRNLFLVLKEALNNAIKYSAGTIVEVTFELKENRYTLSIRDNGIGIAEGVVHGGGNGMVNMRKRMESVKGTIEINSGPGLGTYILLSGTLY